MLRSLRRQQQAAAASQHASSQFVPCSGSLTSLHTLSTHEDAPQHSPGKDNPAFSWAELPDAAHVHDEAAAQTEEASHLSARGGQCRICCAQHSTKACPFLLVTLPSESLARVRLLFGSLAGCQTPPLNNWLHNAHTIHTTYSVAEHVRPLLFCGCGAHFLPCNPSIHNTIRLHHELCLCWLLRPL